MSEELKAKCVAAGVKRVVFVRHAQAAPPAGAKTEFKGIHDWQASDQMRPLTDKGKKQAQAARDAWFAKDVVRTNNKCLVTSGARRAAETLQVFGEQVTANKGFFAKLGLGCGSSDAVAFAVSSELVGGLHPAGIAPACEALFDKHGYAPLAKFYGMDGGKEAYAEYGELVCKELAATVDKVKHNQGNTITVFGHAVFLNAIAMQLLLACGGDAGEVKKAEDVDLGESEGLAVDIGPGGVGASVTHYSLRPHPLW